MKTFIFLSLIILTIGVFSLNANSKLKHTEQMVQAPVQEYAGFKKDISSAD